MVITPRNSGEQFIQADAATRRGLIQKLGCTRRRLVASQDEYWNPLVPELTVRNLEESLRFYLAAGFQVRFKRDAPPFAYLELGQAQIMLEQEHPAGWNVNPLDRPLGRGINLQIEVRDASKTRDTLTRDSEVLFREISDSWYRVSPDREEGQREFLVQDPDGYLLRFSQYLGSRCAA